MKSGILEQTRRGSALIEFAFALAIVTPVLLGGFQFFGAYVRLEEVQQAAIRGAQTAASIPYDSPDETPTPEFRRAVEDAVLESRIPGLRREQLHVAMRFETGRPSEVEVKVAGYQLPVPGGAITIAGKPRSVYPYRGHWTASAR
jgi:Flp pilus assembly protein TadG